MCKASNHSLRETCSVCVRALPPWGCGPANSLSRRMYERSWCSAPPHRRRHRDSGAMASSHGKHELRFADWMASLPGNLHNIPLTNLAIPGECLFHSCADRSAGQFTLKPVSRRLVRKPNSNDIVCFLSICLHSVSAGVS